MNKPIGHTNRPAFNTIEKLDLSTLPKRLRLNWHIYLTLRSDAQIKFAKGRADAAVGNILAAGWCEEFDRAAVAWLEANPKNPVWDCEWPRNAAVFLGNEATDEARRLIAATESRGYPQAPSSAY